MTMRELQAFLRGFVAERDWEQFHSPKNLVMALSVEVAELIEHFQWLSESESDSLPPETRRKVAEEIGDVTIYLMMLADRLGIDPLEAAWDKMEANGRKYPVERARGSAAKYTELGSN